MFVTDAGSQLSDVRGTHADCLASIQCDSAADGLAQLQQPAPLLGVQPDTAPPDPPPEQVVLYLQKLNLADQLVLGAPGRPIAVDFRHLQALQRVWSTFGTPLVQRFHAAKIVFGEVDEIFRRSSGPQMRGKRICNVVDQTLALVVRHRQQHLVKIAGTGGFALLLLGAQGQHSQERLEHEHSNFGDLDAVSMAVTTVPQIRPSAPIGKGWRSNRRRRQCSRRAP